jgi:hypothetical protein
LWLAQTDWDPGKVRRLEDHAAWQFLSRFLRPGIRVRVQESSGPELAALNQYAASNPQVRGAAIFFHFNNLNSDIRSNSDFDYLFSRTLGGRRRL